MRENWWAGVLVGLSAVLAAAAASAEPRAHDGFYFRGAVGVGYLSSRFTVNDDNAYVFPDRSLSGAAIGFDLWLGGSPAKGLIVGGAITSLTVPHASYGTQQHHWVGEYAVDAPLDSSSPEGRLTLTVLGIFEDYYLNPKSGVHVEALMGVAVLNIRASDAQLSDSNPAGPAIGAGIGDDWWVSDEWSIGVLGRFIYAPLGHHSASSAPLTYSTITPALMATVTYN